MYSLSDHALSDSYLLLQIFNGDFEESWSEGEKRESKLVFIGKDLDHTGLKEGFKACLATPELRRKQEQSLRFKVGDRVECSVGPDIWRAGKVIKLMDRQEYMPPGLIAPYAVSLDGPGAAEIYAPADDDAVIRRARGKRSRAE